MRPWWCRRRISNLMTPRPRSCRRCGLRGDRKVAGAAVVVPTGRRRRRRRRSAMTRRGRPRQRLAPINHSNLYRRINKQSVEVAVGEVRAPTPLYLPLAAAGHEGQLRKRWNIGLRVSCQRTTARRRPLNYPLFTAEGARLIYCPPLPDPIQPLRPRPIRRSCRTDQMRFCSLNSSTCPAVRSSRFAKPMTCPWKILRAPKSAKPH